MLVWLLGLVCVSVVTGPCFGLSRCVALVAFNWLILLCIGSLLVVDTYVKE